MSGVKKPEQAASPKTTREVLVEIAALAVIAFPLASPFAVLGWRLGRRYEFKQRGRTVVLAVESLTFAIALTLVGSARYEKAWLALMTWALRSAPIPSASNWIFLCLIDIPAGLLLGSASVLIFEWLRGRHPLHGPRVLRERRSRRHEARAFLATSPENVPLTVNGLPVLGPWLDGDETADCRVGPWAVIPRSSHHLVVIGATGAGKSVTIERLVGAALQQQQRVFFLDGKQDQETGLRLATRALRLGVDRSRVRVWPQSGPVDLWRGTSQELLDRAHSLMEWTEPYYETIAKSALRLAIDDPRGLPASLGEILSRLDSAQLKGAYAGTPLAEVASKLTPELVGGVKLRYYSLDAALKAVGAIPSDDSARGWSIDDVDFTYISLPTSTTPIVAAGFGRALLLDVMTWLRSPARRSDGRKVLLVVEELGALVGNDEVTARNIVEMLERARSAGCQVILSGQSLGSFGDERLAYRILHSGASTICMRVSDPESVLSLVGTRPQPEASLGITVDGSFLDQGSVRFQEQFAIAPDELRTLPLGRAFLIHQGRFTLTQVARLPE